MLEVVRLLNEASDKVAELLDVLDCHETLRTTARVLGMNLQPTKHPPPPSGVDTIDHLKSGAVSEWISASERELLDRRMEVQRVWEQLKADYKPANYWQIARQIGDDDAEIAFNEATQLHENLNSDVPLDAMDRLEQVRKAEEQAWKHLRSQRADPALELAIRIHDHGGWLELTDVDQEAILPLLDPDGDHALRFEIRLRED